MHFAHYCCGNSQGRLLLRSGIIAPYVIREEPVFVTGQLERYGQTPGAVGSFVHGAGLGVPVVEVADQGHLPGHRGGENKLGLTANVAEVVILRSYPIEFLFARKSASLNNAKLGRYGVFHRRASQRGATGPGMDLPQRDAGCR